MFKATLLVFDLKFESCVVHTRANLSCVFLKHTPRTLTMHFRSLELFSLPTMTPANVSSIQWTSSPFTPWSRTTAVWRRYNTSWTSFLNWWSPWTHSRSTTNPAWHFQSNCRRPSNKPHLSSTTNGCVSTWWQLANISSSLGRTAGCNARRYLSMSTPTLSYLWPYFQRHWSSGAKGSLNHQRLLYLFVL